MQLAILGINHSTASVELREKLAVAPERQVEALRSLCAQFVEHGVEGDAVILSTCNRTELILGAGEDFDRQADIALQWLLAYSGQGQLPVDQYLYRHHGDEALAHLLRVGSGLDSMVLGEPQILGQLKSAYAAARMAGAVSARLEPVFQHVFSVVKRVRSSTAIGENPVSVAYAAVLLAQRIFSDFSSVSVLLVGAGETIELVGKHVRQVGVEQMTIANRTIDNALELANSLACHAMLLADLPERLQEFDVIISSTGSQLPILGKGTVEQALKKRKHRPMFLVDIAVPRDIEPQVGELPDAYLYSIDDLKDIIDHNRELRAREAGKAETLIADGVRAFELQRHERNASSLLVAYREHVARLSENELEKARQMLDGGQSPEAVLDAFAHGLTRKIMHGPTVGLRDAAGRQDDAVLAAARRLLGLDDDAGDQDS